MLKNLSVERSLDFEGETFFRYYWVSKKIIKKRIIDIGCGIGYGANYLAKYAKFVTAIDKFGDGICEADNMFKKNNLNFIKIDILKNISKLGTYDCAIAFEIIEHLKEKEINIFFSNVKKILNEGGKLYITTPNKLVSFPVSKKPWYPFHKKEYEPNELRNIAKKYFNRIELFGIKCSNSLFLKKREVVKKSLRIRILNIFCRFKICYWIKEFIPKGIRNSVTKCDTLPLLGVNDYIVVKKEVEICPTILLVCRD